LPNENQRQAFEAKLASLRAVPEAVIDNMRPLVAAGAHPADVLTASISFLSALEASKPGARCRQTPEKAREAGLRLIAQIPTLIAAHHALRQDKKPIPPDPKLGHAENFLHMLGLPCTEENIAVFTKDAILHFDNGASPSAFVALSTSSTWTSMHDTISAAAHAFKGGRHGDAAESAYAQVINLSGPEEVRKWVDAQYDAGKIPNGFGHAVYSVTGDPRFDAYRQLVTEVATRTGNTAGLAKVEAMIEASEKRMGGRMSPNFDIYQGLLYESLGLPVDISVPMYLSYRVLGWISHVLEQSPDQPLVRPKMTYVGHPARPFPQELAAPDRHKPHTVA